MSPRRARILRMVLRRGGPAALVLLTLGYLASGFYSVDIAISRDERIAFGDGMCRVLWRAVRSPDPSWYVDGPGVNVNRITENLSDVFWLSSFSHGRLPEHHFVWFPMWVLAVVPAACTVGGFLWRPNEPGVCHRCRYQREGLDSAVPCPECGTTPRRVA